MITEQYLKTNFLNAYFIDNDRKNIEILTTTEDKKSVISSIISYNEKDPSFQALSKFITIDQLHEETYNKKKKEREIFEQKVIEIAKRDGLLSNTGRVDNNFFPLVVKTIFAETNSDHLFTLKLSLFEIDKIRNSKNEELKKQLRQSKTYIQALECAFDLIK